MCPFNHCEKGKNWIEFHFAKYPVSKSITFSMFSIFNTDNFWHSFAKIETETTLFSVGQLSGNVWHLVWSVWERGENWEQVDLRREAKFWEKLIYKKKLKSRAEKSHEKAKIITWVSLSIRCDPLTTSDVIYRHKLSWNLINSQWSSQCISLKILFWWTIYQGWG